MRCLHRRVQFTPDVLPSDLVGFSMYNEKTKEFEYREGAVFANLFLADEINRTSPKTQSALLEAMEEEKVTVDGITHNLPVPFTVIATENPIGSSGTQMLPESQLDRFMVRLSMGYPDIKSQVELLRDRRKQNPMEQVHQILDGEHLMKMQQKAVDVFISDEILEYISLLTAKTRQNEAITLGISPRGALALSRMARARAYLCDRDYVIPEDVQEIFTDVCGHRLVLDPKARINRVTAEHVLRQILQETEAPGVE